MKIMRVTKKPSSQKLGGFSLMESVVASGLLGVMGAGLFSGLMHISYNLRYAREEAQATQTMMQVLETVRLYPWNIITNSDALPTQFEVTVTPADTTAEEDPIILTSPQIDTYEEPIDSDEYVSDSLVLDSDPLSTDYTFRTVDGTTVDSTTSDSDKDTSAITYNGNVAVSMASITQPYKSTLAEVTVSVQWQSGDQVHTATTTGYISQYGVQSAVSY